jgi:hypothetical protein
MQDEAVDEAENGGVAADAEREREDRNRGKSGPPRQLPACVAQILSERVHRVTPASVVGARREALANGAGNQIRADPRDVTEGAERAAILRLRPFTGDRGQDLGAVAAPELGAIGEEEQAPQPRHVRLALRRRACARALSTTRARCRISVRSTDQPSGVSR